MKKEIMLLLTIVVVGIVVSVSSCEKIAGYECVTSTICNTSVKTCSNGVQSYYKANGKKYKCDGLDCDDAAQKLVDDFCDYKCSDKNEKVEYLIEISKLKIK